MPIPTGTVQIKQGGFILATLPLMLVVISPEL